MTRLIKRTTIHPMVVDLRERRLAQGLGQQNVAEQMGYSMDTLRGIEIGLRNPSVPFLTDYAEFFGCELKVVDKANV